MLSELKVKSFGIIDELIWEPCASLNVITGETGAGKSLVIDAIEALLGGKLDEEDIRAGADSARVEAVFVLPDNSLSRQLHMLLEKSGVVVESDLLISCEFRRQGRTIPRINGSVVTRTLLREIGALLVDVHAQSQHLSLFDSHQHKDYLDAFAATTAQRAAFAESAGRLHALQDELCEFRKAEVERSHRQEILRYQHDEISRAKLRDDEEEELEQKRSVMTSCEKLKALAYEAYQALNGEDDSVAITYVNRALRATDALAAYDHSLKAHADMLSSAAANIEEVARDMRAYEEKLEYDPRLLEEIECRLELIRVLKKKYGATVAQVLEKEQLIEDELARMDSADEDAQRLEDDINKLKIEMGQQAQLLSQKRRQAATRIEKAVQKELAELGMAQVDFMVQILQKEAMDGIPFDNKMVAFNKDGVDDVQFMASTNPGEPLKPLVEIASTGEVSRFTLALKVALAEADAVPVLVFDEIDIGVGGRSGDVIGKKLWSLARRHQVICVTHLPQIAVYASSHFHVNKAVLDKRTASTICILESNARVNELAAMLGGDTVTETAHLNAMELCQKATTWIKTQ